MKFDKHEIQCEIKYRGVTSWAACCDGKIGPLWNRMEDMAAGSKITNWIFWVILERGPIRITAWGENMNYADVERRAERILLGAEALHAKEHR